MNSQSHVTKHNKSCLSHWYVNKLSIMALKTEEYVNPSITTTRNTNQFVVSFWYLVTVDLIKKKILLPACGCLATRCSSKRNSGPIRVQSCCRFSAAVAD